jgi:hypothetical protein
MNLRLFLAGLAIWLAATAALRIAGQRLLHPGDLRGTLILFAVSFPLMAWVVRRLCQRARLPREQWVAGAVSVALPSLLLDPFSCAFFPVVLWCCAGAMVGVLIGKWQSP